MALTNIPRQELTDLLAQYKRLPFPNGTPLKLVVTLPVSITASISITNGDNDNILSVSEAIDVPYDSMANTVKLDTRYKQANTALQNSMEELIQKIKVMSRAYNVPTVEIWSYLSSH